MAAALEVLALEARLAAIDGALTAPPPRVRPFTVAQTRTPNAALAANAPAVRAGCTVSAALLTALVPAPEAGPKR